MRIRPFLLAIVFLGFSELFGQGNRVDSLKSLLPTATDTTRHQVLRQLGIYYRRVDTDSAFYYFNEELTYARRTGNLPRELQALNDLGITNGMLGNYPEAMQLLKTLEEKAVAANNEDWMSSAFTNLGILYKRLGDYPQSLSYYLKDLDINIKNDAVADMAGNYSNLGVLYDLMKEPDKAKEYYDEAMIIYQEVGDQDGISTINQGLGVLMLGSNQYSEASEYFQKCVEYCRKADDRIGLCVSLSNLGNAYMRMEENEKALEVLLEAVEIAGDLKLRQENTNILYNLSMVKVNQRRYVDALGYARMMRELAYDIDTYDLKADAHELMSLVYEKSKNFEQALVHAQLNMNYRDSLLNKAKVAELERQEVVHEVKLKDQELKEQQLNLELLNTRVDLESKLRWGFLAFIAVLAAFLFTLFLRYRSKQRAADILQRKNKLINQQKDHIAEMNVELERRMLRAQINPHFIFNSLSSIQHFITSDDRVSSLKYLSKFTKLLRIILDNSRSTNVLLEEEIEQLKTYIELEALRFDDSFEYSIEVDQVLDPSLYEIPVLLVQPYIENAILHGLMPKEGEKYFSMRFLDDDRFILCVIEDNGVGRDHARRQKNRINHKSHGLAVTKQRLQAMSAEEDQALVEIVDLQEDGQPTGTRVSIRIPKILNE